MKEMKYKVGDKVKIIDNSNGHDFPIGTVGIIQKVGESKYIVEYEDGHDYWWCVEEDLELVTTPCKYKRTKLTEHPDWFEYGYAYECKVSDSERETPKIKNVIAYQNGKEAPYMTTEGYPYKYAEPIPVEPETVTLKIPADILDKVQALIEEAKKNE